MENGKLFYDERSPSFFVLVQGYITAQICPALQERLLSRFDGNSAPNHVEMDLTSCTYMDSTFLGLVASVSKRLKSSGASPVRISGANTECRELFHTLGLENMIEYSVTLSIPDPKWQEFPVSQNPDSELLMRAHKELSDISDQNRKKFATLLEMLKKKQE